MMRANSTQQTVNSFFMILLLSCLTCRLIPTKWMGTIGTALIPRKNSLRIAHTFCLLNARAGQWLQNFELPATAAS